MSSKITDIIGAYSIENMKKRILKRKNKAPNDQRIIHYKENAKISFDKIENNYFKFGSTDGLKIGCYNIYYNRIVKGDDYKKNCSINPKVSFHHIKGLLKKCRFDILCLQEVVFGDDVNKSDYPEKKKYFTKEGKFWLRKDNNYFGKSGHLGIRGGDLSKTEKEYRLFCEWLNKNNYDYIENRPYSSFYDKSFGNMIIFSKELELVKENNVRAIIGTDKIEPETRGYVTLTFRLDNKLFCICNTHLTEKPGNKQVVMIEKILKDLTEDMPIFLCGDMNISNRNSFTTDLKKFVSKKEYPFLQDTNDFYSILKTNKFISIHDVCKKHSYSIPTAWNSTPVDYIGGKNISTKEIKAVALFPSINKNKQGISDHDCIGMVVDL